MNRQLFFEAYFSNLRDASEMTEEELTVICQCPNDNCNWRGAGNECVIPKHGGQWVRLLCPECFEPVDFFMDDQNFEDGKQ